MAFRKKQQTLIDAFDPILAYNHTSLKLYFKTLQPLQFIDLDNDEDEDERSCGPEAVSKCADGLDIECDSEALACPTADEEQEGQDGQNDEQATNRRRHGRKHIQFVSALPARVPSPKRNTRSDRLRYPLGVPSETLIILNPASAAGATGRRRREILHKVESVFGWIELESTLRPGDAARLARNATERGVRRSPPV